MVRDQQLFVDDDGKAYHIFASEDNATLHIAELTDDYLDYTGKYVRVFEGRYMEAPAIFKKRRALLFHGVRLYRVVSECGTECGSSFYMGTLDRTR